MIRINFIIKHRKYTGFCPRAKTKVGDFNKLRSDCRVGDGSPAGRMVEGISSVRYVIAVSRLVPHGARLVLQ